MYRLLMQKRLYRIGRGKGIKEVKERIRRDGRAKVRERERVERMVLCFVSTGQNQ